MIEIQLGEYAEEQRVTWAEFLLLFISQENKDYQDLRKSSSRNNYMARKAFFSAILILLLKDLYHFNELLCISPPAEKACFHSECGWNFFIRSPSLSPPPWIPWGCWQMMPMWLPGRTRAYRQIECPWRMPPSSSTVNAGHSWLTLSYKASNGSRTNMGKISVLLKLVRRGEWLSIKGPTLTIWQRKKTVTSKS